MTARSPRLLLAFLGSGALCGNVCAQEAARSAAQILREFQSVRMPSMSRSNAPEARARFHAAIAAGCRKQAELALELYRSYPEHPSVPELMGKRWACLNNALDSSDRVVEEASKILRGDGSPALRKQAALAAARAASLVPGVQAETRIRIARSACAIAPESQRGPLALLDIAKYHVTDVARIREICEEVATKWKDSNWAYPKARSVLKQLERVGKAAELQFEDLLGGARFDSKEMRGRSYVIQIWSNFGSKMKDEFAYIARLRSAGEFPIVGIHPNRHRPGPAELVAELKRHGVDWPQYYAYEPGQAPWKGPWGTGETPLYLAVDAKGIVRGISYRARNIAKMLETLRKDESKDTSKRRRRL